MYILLFILLILSNNAYADSKMSAFTRDNSPAITDDLPSIKDPSGTPLNRRVSISTVFKSANITVNGTNVGVGSVNPGQILDVTGTVRATAFSGDGSGLSGVGATPGGSGTEIQYRGGASTLSAVTGSGVVGGNIGIGSVNPTTALDVNGTIKSIGFLGGNVGIGTGYLGYATPTNGLIIEGNVGIGTYILPTGDRFASAAALMIKNSATALILNNSTTPSASSGGVIVAQTNVIPTAGDQRLGTLVFGARDEPGAKDFISANRNSVGINAFSSEAWVSGVGVGTSIPGYLTISTTPSGAYSRVEAMRITENQNIGIGTIDPQNKLSVAEITGGTIELRRVDTSVTADDLIGEIDFKAKDSSTTTNQTAAAIKVNATNTVSTDINPSYVTIWTTGNSVADSPTEKVRITHSGNLGIGTTAPSGGLVLGSGIGFQTVGIGTTVPQLPCIKTNKQWGYYDPPWTGACT